MTKLVTLLFVNIFVTSWAIPLIPYKLNPIPDRCEISSNPLEYRLPTDTKPLAYNIILTADPNKEEFEGLTTIQIKCVSNTSRVVLHANQLNITNIKVSDASISILDANQTTDDKHFYTIYFNTTLIKDQVIDLTFEYSAPFGGSKGRNLDGLYKSSYLLSNGTRRYLALTQFQPTHARQVFPCYDEPSFKAVFNIHVQAPKSYRTICNMNTTTTNMTPLEGYSFTSFSSTPLMSTYLVAIVISDFEYKSNFEDGETIYPREYRVYARPTAQDTMDHALDFGQKSFQTMQTYTDVNYRLPKVDNVAVPDFAFGAMENWGLITYREEYLLFFKGISSTRTKINIAVYMSHENAHFWFGDEVSPLWWDYIWLNEGFATYFEIYATEKVYEGKWRFMEFFTVNDMQDVMIQDALDSTTPMTVSVGSPCEIIKNFNSIVYVKAGSVIRMIQHVLGDSLFRYAISSYLKSLPTGVTEPQILYSEMQKVVGRTKVLPENVTVAHIFGSWAEQPGYPVIEINRESNTILRIKQYRFYQNANITSNQTWWIPLTWATNNDPNFSDTKTQKWMTSNTSEITVSIDESIKWVIFNKQQCGYYRVFYSLDMWKNLVNVLNSEDALKIHPVNKAQLIDDAGMFSRTGRLSYNITLELLNYLSQESDWYPWTSANRVISFLNIRMPDSEKYNLYKIFISQISRYAFDEVTLMINDQDDFLTRSKRPLFARIACDAGSSSCLTAAQNSLTKSLQNQPEPIDPDLKPVIYCAALREASESLWTSTFSKYETETETEKIHILNGLGCSQNVSIIDTYLSMTIMDSKLRREDAEVAIRSVINSGPFGVGKVLEFLTQNFNVLKPFLQNNDSTPIIQSLGNVISKDEHIDLFKNFTTKYNNNFNSLEKEAVAGVEAKINDVIAWKAKYMDEIDIWLTENVKGGGRVIKHSILLSMIYSLYILMFKT